MKNRFRLLFTLLLGITLLGSGIAVWAKYKAPGWNIRSRESYPAFLTSEGVTIAVEPLYTDTLAAQVFDRPDMITRGIMPLAVIIFNDNDFAVEVDGLSMELIHKDQHIRTLHPNEVAYRLYRKEKSWMSQPIPRLSKADLNEEALEDFDNKFLMDRTIEPHGKGGGFLYLHIPESGDPAAYLSKSLLYIPKIYRLDKGSRMIFFEIELAPSIRSATP